MSERKRKTWDEVREQGIKEKQENINKKIREEEEKNEALRILESDDPLAEIKQHLDTLIAGEDATKQLLFLLCLSGKIDDPKKKQIIELLGDPGGGKTTIANAITSFFKTKKVGRFSKRALDYSDLEGYEILYIQEIGVMDKEEQGVSTLKFLSSDDQGYTVEVTVMDPETKQFTTQTIKIPPITVVTSTTRTEIDPQFQRRSWPINVDQTHAQTFRIEQFKIQEKREEALIILGLKKETKANKSKRILGHIIKLLDNVQVFMPFPEKIFDILNKERLRARGDFDKFYVLAELYNFLLQRKLFKTQINGRSIVFASPMLTAKMFSITKNPLIAMTIDLEERFLKIIEAMKKAGFSKQGHRITIEDRNKIAEHLENIHSDRTVYNYLNQLFKKEFLSKETLKTNAVDFILIDDLDALLQKKSEVVHKLEKCNVLGLKMIEEAENFINGVLHNELENPHPPYINVQGLSSLLEDFVHTLSKEKNKLSKEIKEKTMHKEELCEESKTLEPEQTLQEKMDTVLKTVSDAGEKGVNEYILGRKTGLTREELPRVLAVLERDRVAWRDVAGYWRRVK